MTRNLPTIRERATSTFPTAGADGPDVVNVSGAPSPSTQIQPRRAGGPTNPDVPGTGSGTNRARPPMQIDARTGQALADADRAALRAAATIPAMQDADERLASKQAAMSAATGAADAALVEPLPDLVASAVTTHQATQVGYDIGLRLRTERTLNRLFGDPGRED